MTRIEEAVSSFESGFNCSQSIFATFAPDYGLDQDTASKIADGFGAGMGYTAEICGAVSGAVMVLGLINGRTRVDDKQSKEKVNSLIKEFIEEFKSINDSTRCRELLKYDISKPEELAAAREKNLFQTKCRQFVEDAAEILDNMIMTQKSEVKK